MKNKLIIFSLCTICLIFSAFKAKAPSSKKNFIQLNKSVYLCKFEVSQADYKIFLESIKSNSSLYSEYYPDTTQWTNKFPKAFTQPWEAKYFSHDAFNNFPIVNITQEAANAYCNWLTKNYKGKKKVIYRLASSEEWLIVAKQIDINKDNVESKDGSYRANLKFKDQNCQDYNYDCDGAMLSASVYEYKDKSSNFCSMIGNVAEMTEEGKIVGGSWENTLQESLPGQFQTYQLPDPRVGFRIVMIIE